MSDTATETTAPTREERHEMLSRGLVCFSALSDQTLDPGFKPIPHVDPALTVTTVRYTLDDGLVMVATLSDGTRWGIPAAVEIKEDA